MKLRNLFVVTVAVALLGLGVAANAKTVTLDMTNAKTEGSVSVSGGIATLDSTVQPGYANIWGKATGGSANPSGFGMQASANQGAGGWAGGHGALLSDVTGVSFDWFRADGGLGGGFRLAMYVFGPAAEDESGFLQFDLSYLLADQTANQWNSTGNWLDPKNGVDQAWYSADFGTDKFGTGVYQTWSQIQATLSGWSVYEIGIINDAGYTASVKDLTVTSIAPVPEPGSILAALSILGPAGLMFRRRKA